MKIKMIKKEDKDSKITSKTYFVFFKGCTKSQDKKDRRTRRTRNIGIIDIFGYSLETFKAAYTVHIMSSDNIKVSVIFQ